MKRLKSFTLLLLTGLLAASCQKSEEPAEEAEEPLLHIGLSTEVRSLDPRLGIDDASGIVIYMLFDGLMAIDLNGKLTYSIAQSHEVSSDQKKYTFHLRPCKWSNGDEVTAYDFEYAWKKIVSSNVKGSAVHTFYPIKNVQAILRRTKTIDEVGISAPDEKTLIVELEHPTAYFLEVLATSPYFPINAKLDQKNPHWANEVGTSFVCNGPFLLKEHRQNDELFVLKNPYYWDAESVKLPGIQVAIVSDPLTQLSMFEKDDLEWIGKPLSKLPLDSIPTLRKEGKLTSIPSLGLYWYFINTEALPFNNKKMRQAFAYAINREEITTHILQEGEKPAFGLLQAGLGVHQTAHFKDNNLILARKLFEEGLKELGLTRETLPPITLNYNTSEYHQRVAQAIQEQWNQAFDVSVELQHEDWKVHYQKLVSGDFQIGGMGWDTWLKDPIYIMLTFRYKSDGINMSRWENPLYQQYIDQTEEELSPSKRLLLFEKAESLLMDEMPVIPIYFKANCFAKKDSIKDVYVSELGRIIFKWAYIEKTPMNNK
jgi:oligopeptide transport system substrate-binding protein